MPARYDPIRRAAPAAASAVGAATGTATGLPEHSDFQSGVTFEKSSASSLPLSSLSGSSLSVKFMAVMSTLCVLYLFFILQKDLSVFRGPSSTDEAQLDGSPALGVGSTSLAGRVHTQGVPAYEKIQQQCGQYVAPIRRKSRRKRVDSYYAHSEAVALGTIMIPEHKMVVCTIPKSGCSIVRTLLLRMQMDARGDPLPSNFSERQGFLQTNNYDRNLHKELRTQDHDEIEAVASDPSWLKIAIVRHPFTRLLSAYREKILQGKFRRMSKPLPGISENSTFTQFLDALSARSAGMLNEHFRDQASLCGFPYMDHYLILQLEKLKPGLRCVARVMGFSDYVESGWGPNGTDSMFDVSFGHEVRGSITKDMAPNFMQVIERFNRDFSWFGYNTSFSALLQSPSRPADEEIEIV
ncbi:hypothetical protein FVE85_0138 [Porphyridium purpureum]|uniref:Uncharacterized protein n=1 Tax=Porphyridium purpureum TaxID=35688 RepID=A0A5J4YXT8_PORPP|nr:hypothetical protein FVE85_0138 [Porphyridium purpureum]|eukprot:POR0580..scf208_2